MVSNDFQTGLARLKRKEKQKTPFIPTPMGENKGRVAARYHLCFAESSFRPHEQPALLTEW